MAPLRAVLLGGVLGMATPAAADPVDRWSNEIAEASARFDIPAEWIRRVMRVESQGRTMLDGRPIVSRAGAIGLMQLMPGTWREMRGLLGLGPDPRQPRDNILAGTAYLRLMYDRFGYPGLFAAYNAGPSRYAAFRSGRTKLPGETRAYLARIAGFAAPTVRVRQLPSLFALRANSNPAPGSGIEFRAAWPGLFVPLGSAAGE